MYKILMSSIALLLLLKTGFAQKYNAIYPVEKYYEGKGYKVGYFSQDGRKIIDYIYDENTAGEQFVNDIAIVKKGHYMGLIDTTGKIVVPLMFSDLRIIHLDSSTWICVGSFPHDSIQIFRQDGNIYYSGYGTARCNTRLKRIFISASGKQISSPFAILMDMQGNRLAKFTAKEKVTIGDLTQSAGEYASNNKGLVLNIGSKYKAITDMCGKILYDSILSMTPFNCGKMVVTIKNKAAVLDENLEEVIPFSAGYKSIMNMCGTPYYGVYNDSCYGIIDKHQNIVVDLKLKNDKYYNDYTKEWFQTMDRKNNTFYYYDYNGKLLLETKQQIPQGSIANTTFVKKQNDTTYLLWKDGPASRTYNFISFFNKEGYAYFLDKDKKGILDTNGKELFSCNYNFLALPVNGVPAAGIKIKCTAQNKDCNKYPCANTISALNGFSETDYVVQYFHINMKGERLYENNYDNILPFFFGQSTVEKRCKKHLIKTNGNFIVFRRYRYHSDFISGVRIVKNRKKQVLVNKTGKLVSKKVHNFQTKEGVNQGYAFFEKKSGYSGKSKIQLLPDFNDGLIIYEKHGKYGLMDTLGVVKVEAQFDRLTHGELFYWTYKNVGESIKTGVMTNDGKVLFEAKYADIKFYGKPYYFRLIKEEGGDPTISVWQN